MPGWGCAPLGTPGLLSGKQVVQEGIDLIDLFL